jgi:urease accessory protein
MAKSWRRAEITGAAEHLFVSRIETDKVRMRRKTDKGTDLGLVLERGSRLYHGDVLKVNGKLIIVVQRPEKVVSVEIGKRGAQQLIDAAALVGHAIGNRHRPIAVERGRISFPVQSESELETFARMMPLGVKLTVTDRIFVPTGEVHHHE